MRSILLLTFLAVALAGASASTWWECNFNPYNSSLIVLTGNGCTSTTGSTCITSDVVGSYLAYGNCASFTTATQGSGVNARVFYQPGNYSAQTTYTDWNALYSSSNYQITGYPAADVFVSYYNDYSGSRYMRNDIDIIGWSEGPSRRQVAAGQTQITVGLYINGLYNNAQSNGNYLMLVYGQPTNTSAGAQTNIIFNGYNTNTGSYNIITTPNTGAIWLSLYYTGSCPGNTIPIWTGTLNGTVAGNDTFVAFFGNINTLSSIQAWSPAGVTRANTTATNTGMYTVCNFANHLPDLIWPETNVNFSFVAPNYGFCGCTCLQNTINAGVVPYGTCKNFANGPAPYITSSASYALNGTTQTVTTSSYYGGSYYGLQLYNDGNDFIALYYNDRTNSAGNPGYTAEFVHYAYTTYSYGVGTYTTYGTWTPPPGSQTWVIGIYANSYQTYFASSDSYLYVMFNNTLSTYCPNAAYYYGYSCLTTVPTLALGGSYNITLYANSPCYYVAGSLLGNNYPICGNYRWTLTSGGVPTTVATLDQTVTYLAIFGNWKNYGGLNFVTYQTGGKSVTAAGGGGFFTKSPAAAVVPQLLTIAAVILAVIVALFH